jgi:hypothetical protein
MKWAIYSRRSDQPLWLSENLKDLVASMAELNRALGDRFYVDSYPRKEGM